MRLLGLLWDLVRNNVLALILRISSYISRSITFPLAFIFEWRNRRFERRGVAARRRELLGVIPRESSVLEVGAGCGATLASGAYTGSIGRFSRIVFTEPDPGMRARLKKKACSSEERIEVFDAALPNLPFEDDSFDAVVAFMVLSFVADRRKSLEEISRVLKPGGKLLLMDHAAHPDERENIEQGSFLWFREWYKFVHVRGARKAQLEVLISDISKHESLSVDFLSRMQTHGLFQEICYGTYTKKKDVAN